MLIDVEYLVLEVISPYNIHCTWSPPSLNRFYDPNTGGIRTGQS